MIGAILSFVTGLLGKLLGGLFGSKDPTPVDLADSNARAQERLNQQETVNEVVEKASAARAAADDRVMRIITSPAKPDADIAASLKQQFPDAFRD